MRETERWPDLPGLELVEEIGRGVHALVYRARRGERQLAVKIQRDGRREEAVRFRREAAMLACLRHPSLPTILEVGDYHGRPYLVMDYVEGKTLARLLADGPLPQDRIVSIASDLAGALAEVHAHGLVHRDVKPENVLIGPDGSARLLDFGLATRIRSEEAQGGEVAGTFLYSSPEQTGMLKRPVDCRSDLYSLGVLLYECAAGQPPFTSRDVGELVRQHAVQPVPDLRSLRPDLSPVLARIVERLLAKDPDDRYQSGKGLLADLHELDALELQGERAVLGSRDSLQHLFETPMVGCDQELELLGECWQGALDGQGGAVLLEGPPGHGKSRLLRELAQRVRERPDALVLQARCSPSDPTPFGALREAVERWLRSVRQLPGAVRETVEARLIRAAGEFAPLLGRFSPALAALLPGTRSGEAKNDLQAPVYNAVARFLVGLAEVQGPTLLVIDDVEWLDEASREVLRRLVGMLAQSRMLFATAGFAEEPGFRSFVEEVGNELALRLPLGPLDEEETRVLIGHQLGSDRIPDELVQAVFTRSQGAPFAVIEYVSAMLDAGLLTPDWGGWKVDVAGLEQLALPSDVAELMVRRLDGLSPRALPTLRAAAVWGSGFSGEGLAAALGAPPEEVHAALAEAQRNHLVERADRNRLGFVHDRVRAALVSQLTGEERARLHRAIASWLASLPDPDPATLFALARHRHLGGASPEAVYESNLAAGRLALEAGANDEAVAFLRAARKAAADAQIQEGSELAQALGTASARAGRFSEAVQHLERALAHAKTPAAKAHLHAELAEVRLSMLDNSRAWQEIEAGFRSLGRPYPTGSPTSWLITLALAAVGTLLALLGVGRGVSDRKREEEHAILARLSNLASNLGYLEGRIGLFVQMTLVPLYSIHRLGSGRELVRALGAQAALVSRWRMRRLAEMLSDRAERVATELGDRALLARARVDRARARQIRGESAAAEALHRANLAENEAWLEAADALRASSDLALNLLQRGHSSAAWSVVAHALARSDRKEVESGHPLPCTAAATLAMAGQLAEAKRWLERAAIPVEGERVERWRAAAALESQVLILLEQGELGPQLEEALARHRALGFRPRWTPFHLRLFWVLQAQARLQQISRGGSIELAEAALRELRRAANTPVLKAHAAVVEAGIAVARGKGRRAWKLLDRVESRARRIDAPWVRFEAIRIRARLLEAEGEHEAALREARLAHSLALDLGWMGRARLVAREFGLTGLPTATEAGSRSDRGSAALVKLERQLAALMQVSRACASVLHPDRVAEVALDQIVSILGAERAILFLGNGTELVQKAARCAAGIDPATLAEHSATVVERVWATSQPLVVSSLEEEATLGAHSIVARDLRSIMAVPLVMRDVAIGVVYVDNRLARGLFGKDDVQILAALASHIGTALETARAVQLEIERKALESDLEKAFDQATTDALTGLRNRRFLETRLADELARAKRSRRPFSLILIDVDHFKKVNDTWGHLAGDRVLATVARIVAQSIRSTDLAARYGGEEFCILAPETDAEGARILAERIREEVAAREIDLPEGGSTRVTASFGVAEFGVSAIDEDGLFQAADDALYAAKESGRNQVRIARARMHDVA